MPNITDRVPVCGYAPDGYFDGVEGDRISVPLSASDPDDDAPPATAVFAREVAGGDEGTWYYRWRRVE